MAVVNSKSDLVTNRETGFPGADPEQARGRPIVAVGTIANLATDNTGSSYHLIDLPADAILDALTCFKVDTWGFADIRIGTRTDIGALVNQTRAAGATVTPIARLGVQHGKRLWQVLGLAKAPSNNIIGLYAHGIANATGAGTMLFELHYRFR